MRPRVRRIRRLGWQLAGQLMQPGKCSTSPNFFFVLSPNRILSHYSRCCYFRKREGRKRAREEKEEKEKAAKALKVSAGQTD